MTVFVKHIAIDGYRGFAERHSLDLAIPNGKPGSGLTVLVGPNNGGKSSVLEALQLCCDQGEQVRLSRGKRNAARRAVEVTIEYSDASTFTLRSAPSMASATTQEGHRTVASVLVVPSRRSFPALFNRGRQSREEYASTLAREQKRTGQLPSFAARLFKAHESDYAERFNKMLSRIVHPTPDWALELEDNGQFSVELRGHSGTHSSEGAGDGILSALILTDALYDADKGQFTAIDEPELSLHPYLQRRVMRLLMEESATRQILIATHSPYFVDLLGLANGGRLARVYATTGGCKIKMLSQTSIADLKPIAQDVNFPHLFGLDARSIFFLDDGVVLVEGQEDAVFYPERVLPDLELSLDAEFFGWGVGGKSNMKTIARILHDLGFERVCGVLDADAESVRSDLQATFPEYRFVCIPAGDVRTKPARRASDAKPGLLSDDNRTVRSEFREQTVHLLKELQGYLTAR